MLVKRRFTDPKQYTLCGKADRPTDSDTTLVVFFSPTGGGGFAGVCCPLPEAPIFSAFFEDLMEALDACRLSFSPAVPAASLGFFVARSPSGSLSFTFSLDGDLLEAFLDASSFASVSSVSASTESDSSSLGGAFFPRLLDRVIDVLGLDLDFSGFKDRFSVLGCRLGGVDTSINGPEGLYSPSSSSDCTTCLLRFFCEACRGGEADMVKPWKWLTIRWNKPGWSCSPSTFRCNDLHFGPNLVYSILTRLTQFRKWFSPVALLGSFNAVDVAAGPPLSRQQP